MVVVFREGHQPQRRGGDHRGQPLAVMGLAITRVWLALGGSMTPVRPA
ncbi:MAG: hypothetical protein AVDCRST_MAG50-1058 [uncultured Acidimicrobiales bacterium]|uniref:Uncharacterized protein n=1 Tax=uncultured Acidimicrobiales bacterium TaxID=310071 RepID=A0A6J4HQI1_9ACTN|nr:MAG: hypothetical protein AVDCRST_MAG50-1058 [uncultured Acidimicrobiales bacterium]